MTVPIGSVPIETVGSTTSSSQSQTVVGTTASQLIASNSSRRQVMVQNTGTTTVYLALGGSNPTTTVYHLALKACTNANDGTGGVFITTMWNGAIQAISSAASGTVVVTELT